jgi:transposase-like protein
MSLRATRQPDMSMFFQFIDMMQGTCRCDNTKRESCRRNSVSRTQDDTPAKQEQAYGIELPGRRTRRRHAPEFREQVVRAFRQPGMSIAAVALANGVNTNMVRKWVVDAEARPARAPTADLGGPARVARRSRRARSISEPLSF